MINHNESFDTRVERTLQRTGRPSIAIAHPRPFCNRYIRLKYDYNSRLPSKSSLRACTLSVLPADHHEASPMANLTYGIRALLSFATMAFNNARDGNAAVIHPTAPTSAIPRPSPLPLPPRRHLNPSLSISTSSSSLLIAIMRLPQLTSLSLFPAVRYHP